MRRALEILLALLALLVLPSLVRAQSVPYPSPVFQNLTVLGTCTGCGGGGGGGVTWPTTNDIVISNSTSSPLGLAPVNGDCVVGSGGIWTAATCPGGALVIGTTPITSGTSPQLLYNNAGILGNEPASALSIAISQLTGGPLGVGLGGTGASTLTAASLLIGNGTSTVTFLAPVNGDCVVGSGGVWAAATCPGSSGGVIWPSNNDIVISNTTSAPNGLAPVNGDCVFGAGGVWTAAVCPGATITIGTTTVTSGTPGALMFVNGSVVGNASLASLLTSPPPIGSTAPASGSFTSLSATGSVSFSGLGSGTQVSCLGLTSGNVVTAATGACGAGGGTFTIAPGLTSTVGTQNTGSQTISGGSTLSIQNWMSPVCTSTTSYTVSYPGDTGATLLANNATSACAFTLRAPSSGSAGSQSPIFADKSGKGFSLVAAGGTAVFYGFVGGGSSNPAFTADSIVQCTDDGSAYWCAVSQGYGQLAIASTSIIAGTNNFILYDNAGSLGNIASTAIPFGTGTINLGGNLLTRGAITTTGTAPETLAFPTGTATFTFPTTTANLAYQIGAFTSGHCLQASGTAGGIADAGAACGSGGGGGTLTVGTTPTSGGFAGGVMYDDSALLQEVAAGTASQVLTWPTSGTTPAWATPPTYTGTNQLLGVNSSSTVVGVNWGAAGTCDLGNGTTTAPSYQGCSNAVFGTGTLTLSANLTIGALTTAGDVLVVTAGSTAGQTNAPNLPSGGSYKVNGTKLPTAEAVSAGWLAGADLTGTATIVADVQVAQTLAAVAFREETALGASGTITVYIAASGTACASGTNVASNTFNANGTAATNQTLTLTTTSIPAGSSLCFVGSGSSATWTAGASIGTITAYMNPT